MKLILNNKIERQELLFKRDSFTRLARTIEPFIIVTIYLPKKSTSLTDPGKTRKLINSGNYKGRQSPIDCVVHSKNRKSSPLPSGR